jgi:antitoxin CcdA
MGAAFDVNAAKKAANLTVNGDLLAKAKSHKINLSATLEKALTEEVLEKEREQWKQENKAGFEAYNSYIAKHGLFNDRMRKF